MRNEASCPYEAPKRAALCGSCCETSGGLPPCVASWLATTERVVIPFRSVRILEAGQGVARAA